MPLPLAGLVALLVSVAAWRASLLTREGALAACAIGAAILGGQGWPGAAVLLAFFIPTSLVSRALPDATGRFDGKQGPRDGWQVAANGGAAALAAVVLAHDPAGFASAAAGLAAAAADTWATSWGAGSRRPPRSIVTGTPVPPGSSGGVSWRGSAGGAGGSAVVALVATAVTANPRLGMITFLCGVGGMLIDSLLGASFQGRFVCPHCEQPTERRIHRCGSRTRPVGGLAWLGNDGVNLLATTGAALAALLLGGRPV